MGACCTREQTAQINELENSVHYNAEEIINTGVDYLSKPELKFEIIKLKKSPEDIQLDLILNNIQNSFQIKTKKISLIEIYNLTIYFKDNYTQSEYLLFDMRRSAEQKEDFLKKMNHINYTYKQIKDMKDKKLENFRTFLDNKKIIFIISEKHLSKENKVKVTPFEIINLLFNINPDLNLYLLDSVLSEANIPSIFNVLLNLLSDKSYEKLPFILFCYRHVSTFYIDGYIFINFFNQNIFSFESLINELRAGNNEFSFENKFLKEMNIFSMININNNSNTDNEYKITENRYKKYIYKNIYLSKGLIYNKKNEIKLLCDYLRDEVIKGHSIYINIENYDENNDNNDWVFVIIIILTYIVRVNYIEIADYLKEKINFIQNVEQIIEIYIREIEGFMDEYINN